MQSLVVYDSLYGNTEKVAKKISEGLPEKARLLSAKEAKEGDLRGANVVGEMGFIVEGTKGPLKEGELERATPCFSQSCFDWVKTASCFLH